MNTLKNIPENFRPTRILKFKNELREKARDFVFSFPIAVFLDSCGNESDEYGTFEWIAAATHPTEKNIFLSLEILNPKEKKWLFGGFSYDLKSKLEPAVPYPSEPGFDFPEIFFFEPEVVIAQPRNSDEVWIWGDCNFEEWKGSPEIKNEVAFSSPLLSNFPKEKYIENIKKIRTWIQEGEFYEMNFCREFSAGCRIHNPVLLWENLIAASPMPFSALLKKQNVWSLGASPERFLALRKNQLITQPIKGTIRRNSDPEIDKQLAAELQNSEKDRAENVMITDLARNDLNRSCHPGTVEVPALFEVKSFPGLHHLISTVTGIKRDEISSLEAITNCFPPGSMTGAPKINVMQLADQLEKKARGLYAGSIGYFCPWGDFDFNVVIRTLLYDAEKKKISFHVGGAITWDSVPEMEFEETEIKAAAIFRTLNLEIPTG